MVDDKNYYDILGIPPDASSEQIKDAYRFKSFILHSDHLQGMPERVRRLAEEELKKVNEAYSVLSNPERRRQYDIQLFGSTYIPSDLQKTKPLEKPKPEIYPATIRFKDALPYVKQKDVFFVRNVGGPYKKVLIGKVPEWVRIVRTSSLQSHGKLPMRVEIEATGIQWGKVYSGQIMLRLDDVETAVKVKLHMSKKPR